MREAYGIHWFRRDLRVAGNPALQWSWKENSGRVVGVFCFDKRFLSRPDFSANRFQFFLNTLEVLRKELLAAGSDLLVLDEGPLDALPALLYELTRKYTPWPKTLSWNRDYEPFARGRDLQMVRLLEKVGIRHHTQRDHLLIEPPEVYQGKDSAEGYQVYKPFAKRWKELFKTSAIRSRIEPEATANQQRFRLTWEQLGIRDSGFLAFYQKRNAAKVDVPLPRPGQKAALKVLHDFRDKISRYATQRDVPL